MTNQKKTAELLESWTSLKEKIKNWSKKSQGDLNEFLREMLLPHHLHYYNRQFCEYYGQSVSIYDIYAGVKSMREKIDGLEVENKNLQTKIERLERWDLIDIFDEKRISNEDIKKELILGEIKWISNEDERKFLYYLKQIGEIKKGFSI